MNEEQKQIENNYQNELAKTIRSSNSNPKKKNNIFAILLISSIIAGFLGGLFSVSLYLNQNKSSDSIIPGVTPGTKTIEIKENSDVINVVKEVLPSVVSIISVKDVQGFFGSTSQEKGGGSGFIISEDGLILTNKHVVEDTTAKYTVFTNDGKDYQATIESLDPAMDLAIIKIQADNLKPIELGDSNNLQIGQRVIAVGNALGEFQNTVTEGIISALQRTIQASDALGQSAERLDGLLQTDAPINPGNSGGPLINLAGQVIGVNTAVASLSESQGIGFAQPINFAKTALQSYLKNGKITRPYLGIRYVQLTPEIAQANDLASEVGALIYASSGQSAVIAGGPAATAGLKQGDIITAINNEKITADKGLVQVLQNFSPGDTVTISYIRDNDTKTTKLTLGEIKG